ncbi:MAG TPA: hypothetical protein VNE58_17795, partial [Casimicrobiaceae bacterium]|nr:hypothetical protein [Casimicrobiaceae bacterium]
MPPSAFRKGPPQPKNALLVRSLGWLSIGLGAIELLAPHRVNRAIGADDGATSMRLYGLRELACGLGLLSGRNTEAWLWACVA